jgi:hypothetical protein
MTTGGRPFPDKESIPSEKDIEQALGGVFSSYQKIIALTGAFSRDWIFTKGSGWMLKISERQKALLYLIPLTKACKLSMAIRGAERDSLLHDRTVSLFHPALANAKKVSEGFALQILLSDAKDEKPVLLFLQQLIHLRLAASESK